MSITITHYDDVVILSTKGNLMGGKETDDYHQMVKDLLEGGKTKIIADLSKVKWMNSKGLGMLMGCFTSCKNAGGNFKVAGAAEKVKSLLMITKLLTIFDAFDTVDEAVVSYKLEAES
jgi:anti-sigma B factor antagonist